jgi:hypothetical protein
MFNRHLAYYQFDSKNGKKIHPPFIIQVISRKTGKMVPGLAKSNGKDNKLIFSSFVDIRTL